MKYMNFDDYVESYGYFLIDEAFNARQMYLEMMDLAPEGYVTEAQIIALSEGVIENLKNFIITIGKRISEAIAKFIGRVQQVTEMDSKWLNDNQAIIMRAGVIDGATFNNFHDYDNVDQIVNTKVIDDCNRTILESNKDRWEDEEGYISTNTDLGIAGFRYNAGGSSLKDQLQTFLRGPRQDNVSSSILNQQTRGKYFQYCLQTFPAAKTTINAEKEALAHIIDDLEAYIESERSKHVAPVQPSDVSTTQAGETIQANVNPSTPANVQATPAAFEFDTADSFFNEVDIKSPKVTNKVADNKVDQKVDTQVNYGKKKNEEITKISKAARSYFRVNSKKLSAKMNICMEAYRTRLKLLKWYVNESQKDKGNKVKSTAATVANKARATKEKWSDALKG